MTCGTTSSAALKTRKAALCIAETEKLSTPPVFTADYAYLRLRREDYQKKDIKRWAKIVGDQQKLRDDVYVYFMHEKTGSGPKFAAQLMAAIQGD